VTQGGEGGDAVAHGGGSGGGEGSEQEDQSDRGGVHRTEVEVGIRRRDTQRVRKKFRIDLFILEMLQDESEHI
jgi:hypothetical protein